MKEVGNNEKKEYFHLKFQKNRTRNIISFWKQNKDRVYFCQQPSFTLFKREKIITQKI